MTITSKLIFGSKPSKETLKALKKETKVPTKAALGFMLFEVAVADKTVYCCFSGGEIEANGELNFSLVGLAAIEALINLPMAPKAPLILQELKVGPTPVAEKIHAALRHSPADAKICFIGDMAGELDGRIFPALNVGFEVIDLSK